MKKFAICSVVLLTLLSLADPSYAYLDPGSGSMIWQFILVGLASAAVFFKFFWHKLTEIFGSAAKKKSNSEQSDTER